MMMTSSQTIICESCGYENDASLKICWRCNSWLHNIATGKMQETPETEAIFRGGSKQAGKALYLHIHGDNQSITLKLSEGGDYIIGRRDPERDYHPDVDLTDYQGADKGVSRRHAELTYVDDMLRIIDLDSANYTYLNDLKLVPYQPRIVREHDILRFGHFSVTLQFGETE